MQKGICYIVGAGENHGLDFTPTAADTVIAADAGVRYLERAGIAADLVIGDFDTLGFVPAHRNVIPLSAQKDDTDTFAAVRAGMEAGYSRFAIYGGTGGRIDHTIANLQTLAYLSERKMQGFLVDRDSLITAVTDGEIAFGEFPSGYLSVFAYSAKARGVSLRGLKYELEDAELTNTFPLGVSNEFIGARSVISVKDGTLLVVFPREARICLDGGREIACAVVPPRNQRKDAASARRDSL